MMAHLLRTASCRLVILFVILALTEKDDNTECILSQLQALHLKIDRLEKQDTRNNIFVNTTDLSSVLKPKNVIEILVNCRSVEIIFS